ncbi:hypothetical protein [Neobacillus dielmonensis]|uniref:hypothetical protein n=1 Tax=Neobacillus dielmonensis TaxID=1347369 RepID=UPI0005A685EC|nr:hypothetical protein [Neobacillus dielmonensis]
MADSLDPIDYQTGTSVRTFNILDTSVSEEGYDVTLNIDLDSGYDLEGVKMHISFEDLTAYETKDIHQAVSYALGFFDY